MVKSLTPNTAQLKLSKGDLSCILRYILEQILLFTVRNEFAKVMFLQASVCPHGGRGGGCLPQCMLGYQPWSRHPPGADTHPEQTPPEQTPPEQTPPRADTPSGADIPPLPGDMATAADGTHPTGMHSCSIC